MTRGFHNEPGKPKQGPPPSFGPGDPKWELVTEVASALANSEVNVRGRNVETRPDGSKVITLQVDIPMGKGLFVAEAEVKVTVMPHGTFGGITIIEHGQRIGVSPIEAKLGRDDVEEIIRKAMDTYFKRYQSA